MKRFIVSVLFVTVFCIGLGALAENVGARFKSDERALALIKQARIAIGGEQSIADVRSMLIKGNTAVTFKVDGASRTEQGETEIAMQLPDKLSKMVKIGRHDGAELSDKMVNKQHDVIIMRADGKGEGYGEGAGAGRKQVILKKTDGDTAEIEKIIATDKGGEWKTSDGKTIRMIEKTDGPAVDEKIVIHGKSDGTFKRHHDNELVRTTLALLLTAPEGIEVNYTFGGEGDVDGTGCNIVNAEVAGSTFKLYLSKSSSLPVMVSYQGHAMPRVMAFKVKRDDNEPQADKIVTFNHKVDAPELAEIQIKFSDYRSTNGVQLPYKWTTTVAGQTTEVFDVTGYEINPTNIGEKFPERKVFVRTKKDGQ